MTNKNKKRQERGDAGGSGYRAPTQAGPARRRGLFDGLFGGAAASTPMPKLRTTFARGFATATSTPLLILGVPLVLLLEWLVLVIVGFQGPFARLMNTALAVPPVGTLVDVAIGGTVFAGAGLVSLLGVFGLLLWRAVIMAVIATATVERLRTGTVSSWTFRRAVRVTAVTFAVGVVSLSVVILAQFGAASLGAGLGLLVFFGALVFGFYFTGFAPAIAADEDRSLSDTMRRSFTAARMPGSNNLTLAALYTLPMLAVFVAPLPGSLMGVNPPFLAWGIATFVNVSSVAVASTLVVRYLSVAPFIEETPAPARRR